MGLAKQQMEEDFENGYYGNDELFVCSKHFQDKDLVNFIEINGNSIHECSFCDEESMIFNSSITWTKLMERIFKSIDYFYTDPANELGYNDGEYFGDVFDKNDLVKFELGLNADDEIIDEVIESIDIDAWCMKDFYGDRESKQLFYSWKIFSDLVKFKVRYLFSSYKLQNQYNSNISKPYIILEQIGDYINKLNLISKFPESTNLFNQSNLIYRARQHSEKVKIKSSSEIGTPSWEFAKSNRFSPEGIPIFYGAEDDETAIIEIINKDNQTDLISIGTFYPKMDLNLIDLRDIELIGKFDIEHIELYEPSLFLREFAKIITKPIITNEKIEYIPSQVVMEYFRHILPLKINKEIHGIVYNSAKNEKKSCFAIFADSLQCSDVGDESKDTILVLKKDSIQVQSVKNILKN